MGSQWSSHHDSSALQANGAATVPIGLSSPTLKDSPSSASSSRKRRLSGTHSQVGNDQQEEDNDEEEEDMEESRINISDNENELERPVEVDGQRNKNLFCFFPKRKRRRTEESSTSTSTFTTLWGNFNIAVAKWHVKHLFLRVFNLASEGDAGCMLDELEIQRQILDMLDIFQSQDRVILQRGWKALSIIFNCPCRPGQLPAREDPVVEDLALVAMVMDRRKDNERLQIVGCRAMRYLVSINDNWNALHIAGALPALVNAMKNFPDKSVLQGLAMSFIAVMMKEVGDVIKIEFHHLGGIPLILRAARTFPRDEALIHTVLCPLYQLSSPSTRLGVLRYDAADVLLEIIRNHTNSTTILELALGILNKFSENRNLSGRQIIRPMLNLMKDHSDNERIQCYSLVLIKSVGRVDQIPLQPTISTVIAAMQRFPDSGGVLFFGCAVLWLILSRNHGLGRNEALELLSSLGGLEVITTAALKHRDVLGLAPVTHLILLFALDNRRADDDAATLAFGGTERIIPYVTGLHVQEADGDEGNDNNAVDDQNNN